MVIALMVAYNPQAGHFFNPNKLLLDPYARAINAPVNHDNAWLGYDMEKATPREFGREEYLERARWTAGQACRRAW